MRKLAAAVLAAPVIASFYVPLLMRRSVAARAGIVLALGVVVTVVGFGFAAPETKATPPLPEVVPLSNAAFTSTIAAGELDDPVTISFSTPMDPRSVEASLAIDPPTAVTLAWDATGTRVTIRPKAGWAPDTYHTITVQPGALAATGRPMEVAARAVFASRAATSATIVPTAVEGDRATVATAVRIAFDHPVDIGAVRRALVTEPAIRGALDVVPSEPGTTAFVFTPSAMLAPATAYSVRLVGLRDASGATLPTTPAVAFTTTEAPSVVRFRPAHGTSGVDRSATLSVRFTQSMDEATTKAAFIVTADGKAVAGKVSFAEKSTVLVFRPSEALPYGAEVEMFVKPSATSLAGAPLAAASSVRIRIEAKAVATSSRSSGGSSGSSSAGSSVGGGSWAAVETYYLKLMNCTRTGGRVTSSGGCSSPGGRNVAALWIDAGISSKVARPYAKKLATSGACSHFIGGNPGDRLRAAGYTSYIWAENLGCRSGDPYKAVLGSHLYFQSESSYNGGHYVNLMNSKYDRVGIGVWVSGGRVRLVVDFYHPR